MAQFKLNWKRFVVDNPDDDPLAKQKNALSSEILGTQEEIAKLIQAAMPDDMHPTPLGNIYGVAQNRFSGASIAITEQLNINQPGQKNVPKAKPFLEVDFSDAIKQLEIVSKAKDHTFIGDHEITADDKKAAQHAIDKLIGLTESLQKFGATL